jgi:hypothetical protein
LSKIVCMQKTRRTLSIALAIIAALAAVSFGAATPAAAKAGPQLTGTTLTLSHSTIYPHIDGYRDSLGIELAKHVTGASGSIALTGALTISRAGKIVASYPITTSTTETYTWSGRVNDKIVAGHYTVTAKVTGPNGTITKSSAVAVSHEKLLPHTSVVTVSAQEFFQHSYTATSESSGCAAADAGAVACTSAAGIPATGGNYFAVPSRVLEFAGYSPYSAHVAVSLSHVTIVAGTDNYWEWDGTHRYAFTVDGTHSTSTSTFGSNDDTQELKFRVGGGSAADFDKVSITYVYSILG